ncbi:hypothetical protein ACH5RR_040589 [Cinchona calisaya]|uniref:F-box protein n=1 Tax=Cinchona calisaya TaxID=153742 RepID=A0ABD2XUA1_9GENT
MGEDWSELLPDLLFMIARKIQVVKDFTAFRGVCTSWRGAASKQDFNKPWPRQFPLLMLSEKQESDDREFISLSKGYWRPGDKSWTRVKRPEDFEFGAISDLNYYKGKFYAIDFGDDSVEAYTWTKQGGGKDMGVYNLENGKIQRFDHFQSFSLISPPVWVMISI